MSKMTVKYIKPMNLLVMKNEEGRPLFTTTQDSLIISVPNLAYLLNFLLCSNFISPGLLLGILEEYNTFKSEIKQTER